MALRGYRSFGELLPFEDTARYTVEDVRALVYIAERLKQPSVKDITTYGG